MSELLEKMGEKYVGVEFYMFTELLFALVYGLGIKTTAIITAMEHL